MNLYRDADGCLEWGGEQVWMWCELVDKGLLVLGQGLASLSMLYT